MPIGVISPTMIVARLMSADRRRRCEPSAPEVGIEPLPLAPRGVADGAVALVQRPHDAVGAGNDLIEAFCRSFALNGRQRRAAPSSLPWVTPSARAI